MEDVELEEIAMRVASSGAPDADPMSELTSIISECRSARGRLAQAYVDGLVRESAYSSMSEELWKRVRAASDSLRPCRDEMVRTVSGLSLAARSGSVTGGSQRSNYDLPP